MEVCLAHVIILNAGTGTIFWCHDGLSESSMLPRVHDDVIAEG